MVTPQISNIAQQKNKTKKGLESKLHCEENKFLFGSSNLGLKKAGHFILVNPDLRLHRQEMNFEHTKPFHFFTHVFFIFILSQ